MYREKPNIIFLVFNINSSNSGVFTIQAVQYTGYKTKYVLYTKT